MRVSSDNGVKTQKRAAERLPPAVLLPQLRLAHHPLGSLVSSSFCTGHQATSGTNVLLPFPSASFSLLNLKTEGSQCRFLTARAQDSLGGRASSIFGRRGGPFRRPGRSAHAPRPPHLDSRVTTSSYASTARGRPRRQPAEPPWRQQCAWEGAHLSGAHLKSGGLLDH